MENACIGRRAVHPLLPVKCADHMNLPIRIAVLHFSRETVTFLPNDTTLEDFIYPGSPAGGEALLTRDPRGYRGSFVKMAPEFSSVELVGIESPLWPGTSTGSGWITTEAATEWSQCMSAEGDNDRLILD